MPRHVLAALAALLLLAPPASAFSSMSWGEALQDTLVSERSRDPRHDHGYRHRQITVRALEGFGFTPAALRFLGWHGFLTDWDQYAHTPQHPPNGRYRPGDHFDRNEDETSAEAFERGLKALALQRRLAVSALRRGEVEAGLMALGRGLHGVQDCYAHSNVIDLAPADQRLVLALQLGQAAEAPASLLSKLRLAGSSRYPRPDIDPTRDREPGFTHDHWAKDNAGYNREARAPAVGAPGHTKYERAFELAVAASRAYVARVRDEAGVEAWARALGYSEL
jgi:hypothetical protein